MKTNDDYISFVLGETGVGKSSFINGITNSNNCEVGDKGKACTVKFKISRVNIGYSQYSFIDTPGLNDAKGDEKNINEIKNGLSDYPNFRCIIILLKFQDTRLNRQ
jgi:predicted GTPase